jgi:predicted MPP superfamily phosphohydrolase
MAGMALLWWFLLALAVLLFALAWVGHAYIWTALLNFIYGHPLPKLVLKPWRYATGGVILAFPLLITSAFNAGFARDVWEPINGVWGRVVLAYAAICLAFGGLIFPASTVRRLRRKPPACVAAESARTLDLWPELGAKLVGDGKLAFAARLPGNGLFRVEFTELTLAVPDLPPEWDGLTILTLSDLHFHGTPSRVFFDRVVDELAAGPPADLVCLLGDFVDTDTHHEWIRPLLGRLSAPGRAFAILGNHDRDYHPARVRAELAAAGYTVLGNGWREVAIRGVRCVVVGHEGPWFAPPPDLSGAPDLFRLCLSHTPDNFYWGVANRVGLMLCGHVHGGAVRVPVIGSIFVPSVYGRRFDCGVFEKGGTVMAVNRGLSGREPIRFRCNPEVMRVKLVSRKPD